MRIRAPSRTVAAPRLLTWLMLGLVLPAGCTVLLSDDAVQCRDNTMCARFAGSVCDLTNGVCVPMPSFPDAAANTATGDAGAPPDAPVLADAAGSPDRAAPGLVDGGGASPDHRDSASAGADVQAAASCPDLDHNTIADCRESLVTNPDFAAGVAGWAAELGVTQSAPGASTPNASAGALIIVNANQSVSSGSSMAGTVQCLAGRSEVAYALYAEVLIPTDQDASTLAGISLQSFATPDCSGPPNAVVSPALIAASGASVNWQQVQLMLATPAATSSISVRLVVVKPFSKPSAQAYFDNVLLKVR